MSVQLIVYPQSYDGLTNSSNTSNQFFVDGINFNNVNASANTAIATTLPQGAISYYNSIMAVNTWYRYYDADSTNVYEIASFLRLISGAGEQNGIIQKLSNLTIGAVYDVEVNVGILAGAARLLVFSGTTLQSTHSLSSGTQTLQFTANSTQDTILIDSKYISIGNIIQINTIGVTAAAISPSGAIQLLEDGQVICDLYEDEDLPLTLSVDDFKNVAEKVQSYSKAFNLPSTKRNNKIFNAIFEVTRENDGLIFNPYKKTKCVLKQDGFILFEGYLRMLDVTDKEGEISYNVNLYSEVIALADTLKDRTFRDLDFLELNHNYNDTQIKNSWNDSGTGITYLNTSTSGFRDAYSTVKYPFVDWNHKFTLSGSVISFTSIANIYRPFISIKYLVDRIFEATPFTYESSFFNTTDFKKLFMDFNWGSDYIPTSSNLNGFYGASLNLTTPVFAGTTFSPLIIQSNQTSIFDPAPADYSFTTNILTNTVNNTTYGINYTFTVKNTDSVDRIVELQWLSAGVVFDYSTPITLIPNQTYIFTGGINIPPLAVAETLQPQFKASSAGVIEQLNYNVTWVQSVYTFSDMLNTLRGELGQWDFLKGLITMFNLVTLVDEDNPNNILIEPYSDVFIPTATTLNPLTGTTLANRGIEHDWTDKIDVSEMKLTPLTDLNKKTIFKFVEDDDDYSFNQYKNQVGGHLYGSKKFNAGNEFNILDGEDEIVAEPFAATVVKPLQDTFPDFLTPAIYAINDDVEEGFDNSPRIMYNNGIKTIAGYTYRAPLPSGSTGITSENQFLQFSHLTEIPTSSATPSTTIDFHFGECQLLTGDAPTPNNLFNLYWLPYYSELYNPNTRTMTLKVNLSPADINTFKFNDRVFIKNRVFRVNKIDYKPNDLATVEFILIP